MRRRLCTDLATAVQRPAVEELCSLHLPKLLELDLAHENPLVQLAYPADPVRSSKLVQERVLNLIFSIFTPFTCKNTLVVQQALLRFFVLVSHPKMVLVHGSDLFVRLCYRVDIKPSFLKFRDIEPMLQGELTASIRNAVHMASLLAPDIVPELISLAQKWMESTDISQDDVAFYQSDPSSLYLNVLATAGKVTKKQEKSLVDAQIQLEKTRRLEIAVKIASFEKALAILETIYHPALFGQISGLLFGLISSHCISYVSGRQLDRHAGIFDERISQFLQIVGSLHDPEIVDCLLWTIGVDKCFITRAIDLSFLKWTLKRIDLESFSLVHRMYECILHRSGRALFKEKEQTELIQIVSEKLSINDYRTIPLLFRVIEYPSLELQARNNLLTLAMTTLENDLAVIEFTKGLFSPCEVVVETSLDALLNLDVESSDELALGVNMCIFGPFEDLASKFSEGDLDPKLVPRLIDYALLAHTREQASLALSYAIQNEPDMKTSILQSLYETYIDFTRPPEPTYTLGMLDAPVESDTSAQRQGIATCISILAPKFDRNDITLLFDFLIYQGAFADPDDTVRSLLLTAALSTLSSDPGLMEIFESYNGDNDYIRQAIVILMGTLATFMKADDPRIPKLTKTLVDTLAVPSENIQIAVAERLSVLFRSNKDPKYWIDMLMTQLWKGNYASKRGAAYGIAGVIKGAGIMSLRTLGVMDKMKIAVQSKDVGRKEAALFVFETLSFMLHRFFEPHVIAILPFLLVCFGDADACIRQATQDTCKVIMSKLSAHCVKLLLPSLIAGLSDRQWRTQTGSLEVIASMSYLAPKQLSVSLPTIIPHVCRSLSDSHKKVQTAAHQTLDRFGSVIKNPEIQEIVPILIEALVEPNKTLLCLDALLETTFVHYIDSASLAFLIPVVHRGLTDKSGKRKAAQIMGNMATLAEQQDLVPYLPQLVPSLMDALVDPVPENRGTSAKAFGRLVSSLGESRFPTLVADLFTIIGGDVTTVDRAGAAQGLSEVIFSLGTDRLDKVFPMIVDNCSSTIGSVREGYSTLLVYLPNTFQDQFLPYIPGICPCILAGMADEVDAVREAILLAGKVIVKQYAAPAISLLLPQLEIGLFDPNWRIRLASVKLLEDLLFQIAGITSRLDDSEDAIGTEQGREALKEAIGTERYQGVLASIYIVRGDISVQVRQVATNIWKSIVSNTPRTLKGLLTVLMNLLINSLASPSAEKRGIAARALGDLVQKLGDTVLTEIVPVIKAGLKSENANTRQGACIGMAEMMIAAESQTEFLEECAPLVELGLTDPDHLVRESASKVPFI